MPANKKTSTTPKPSQRKPTPANKKVPAPRKPIKSFTTPVPSEPQLAPLPVAPPVLEEPISPTSAPVPPAPSQIPSAPSQPMEPGDERTWGMLAHLSTLVNLVTGFGGPIAAFIMYLVYKDRSRFVAYHALQAMVFQLIWWYGGGVLIGLMWAIVGGLSALLIGIPLIPFALLCTPIFLLLPIGAIIYGLVGAVQTSQGRDFKYWLVGDWMRGTLTGK